MPFLKVPIHLAEQNVIDLAEMIGDSNIIEWETEYILIDIDSIESIMVNDAKSCVLISATGEDYKILIPAGVIEKEIARHRKVIDLT